MPTDSLEQQLQASLGTAYALERELGGGGMSRVFLAEETRFRRRVVIKVLSPELAQGLSAERFEREIGLAAALQQANVVPVITAGDVAGLPWYSMPYVEGESLRARLARGPVAPAEAVHVLRDVAKALAYAHERGIVHRDIKPENILLSGGTAVVTDFGIAKAVSASRTAAPGGTMTQAGMSLGTPAYMAPEQAAGDEVDHRADLYSFGVVAYETLRGRHPFAGKTTAQQYITAHLAEAPPPLDARSAGVPPELAALAMRCLEKDRARRPQSAAEVIAALDAVRTGEQPRPARGGRRALPLVAAGLLLVGGAAAVAVKMRGRPTAGAAPAAADAATIAVLPFEHQGPAEQAYFADGLTDAITGKLVGIAGLTVIDRRSVAAYKGTTKPAAQIGKELGVAYLLEGVVRWARDDAGRWSAQVTPTLVRTRDGTAQWAGDALVVTPTDPFSAQVEIAGKVVAELGVAIGARERASIEGAPTKNPEAYSLYLRAQALLDDRSPGARERRAEAAPMLERATRLDPSFALAFAARARIESPQAGRDTAARRHVDALLDSALAIDPELPEAHFERGDHLWFDDGRYAEGLAELARAAARKPGDAQMLSMLGTGQVVMGQTAEGFANIERTTVLDPRDRTSNNDASIFSIWFRRLDAAERHTRRMLALDPGSGLVLSRLVWIALERGDTAAARLALADLTHATGRPNSDPGLLWKLPPALASAPRGVPALALPTASNDRRQDSLEYYAVLGAWARETGQPDRSRVWFDSALRVLARKPPLAGRSMNVIDEAGKRAIPLAAAGRAAEARRAIAYADSVTRLSGLPNEPVTASAQDYLAYAELLLGDKDAALTRLERLLVLPSGRTPAMLRTMWPYTSLHADPRFRRLAEMDR